MVDRSSALDRLPPAYSTALRLRDEGATHAAIAQVLDVPPQAVPRLLEIGAAKLNAALDAPDPSAAGF
jgi:DNA-directed RNA polymerase specialized sigma24 family protein